MPQVTVEMEDGRPARQALACARRARTPVLHPPLARAGGVYHGKPAPMRSIAVIPARLASTRLPRKALREIAGKLLIGRVYEAVRGSRLLDDVIIATDSDEIMEACQRHGWKAQMTSAAHRSGTERVHEISQIRRGRRLPERPGRRAHDSSGAHRRAA